MKTWTPEEIRIFRKAQKMNQSDFGRMIGVTQVYMSYLEKGVRHPSTTLRLLLDCLEREYTRRGKGGDQDGSISGMSNLPQKAKHR